MDAEYLKDNVGDSLSAGLAAVVLNNPEDPVDYLAQWLLNSVDANKKADERAAREAELKAKHEADSADVPDDYEDIVVAVDAEEEGESATDKLARTIPELDTLLEKADGFEGLLQQFIELLQPKVRANSAYVGQLENPETIGYVAATGDDKFLLAEELKKGSGVTFGVFGGGGAGGDDEEEEEEEEGEGGKKPADDGQVFVPNLLLGPGSDKVKFFKEVPDLGSFFALRVNYEGTLNNESLDDAIAQAKEIAEAAPAEGDGDGEDADGGDEDGEGDEGDEKEAKEEEPEDELTEEEKEAKAQAEAEAKAEADELLLQSRVKKTNVQYALCLDTKGSNYQFSAEELATVKKYGAALQDTLLRLDRKFFVQEREVRAKAAEWAATYTAPTEEEVGAAVAELAKEAPSETDAKFQYYRQQATDLKEQLTGLSEQVVCKGPAKVVQAVAYLLGYESEQVSGRNNVADWDKIRKILDEDFAGKLEAYDPRSAPKDAPAYAKPDALEKLLEGVAPEEVQAASIPLAVLLHFTLTATAVFKVVAEEEKAAAEAAAAAEGGDGEAGGEGDEEEEDA